jgi:hypothetical protein
MLLGCGVKCGASCKKPVERAKVLYVVICVLDTMDLWVFYWTDKKEKYVKLFECQPE